MEEVNSTLYIWYINCRNFYKCHNVLPPNTQLKKENKTRRGTKSDEKMKVRWIMKKYIHTYIRNIYIYIHVYYIYTCNFMNSKLHHVYM
jgi:hypothetical protein